MMSRKKAQAPVEEEAALVDVTAEETHYTAQCEDIRLITSVLKPLIVDTDKDTSTRFAFRIHAVVEGLRAYSYLEVKINYFYKDELGELEGFNLAYVMMGTFGTNDKIPQPEFVDFVRMYTLTILWPYAREYATDQFRRAGNDGAILPIINPQVVTQKIIEGNLIEVEIVPPEQKQQA
jgi:preprotein translocase subunit SecB